MSRPNSGHTSHVHVSVGVGSDGKSVQPYDDTNAWDIGIGSGGSAPVQKETIVNKQIAYDIHTGKLDDQGNGYVDIWHGEGRDPVSVQTTIVGGFALKQGSYPQIGKPTLLKAWYNGNQIRITVVGGVPRGGFGIDVLASW